MLTERLRRWATVAVAGAIVLSVTAAARSAVPGTPAAPRLPALRAGTLHERYEANHRFITESRQAALRMGDTARGDALAGFAAPGRQFLSFSPDGDGLAVEVLGDLAEADRIAVVVPGSDTTIDTFDELGTKSASLNGGARALYAEMRRTAPHTRVAVVAWLGYHAPRTMSRDVASTARAAVGGDELRAFLGRLRSVNATAPVALLCHSYGSVVCGSAVRGTGRAMQAELSGIAVVGSPGMGVRSAAELRTAVPLWAARGASDWITDVPHVEVSVLGHTFGFGTDPVAPSFGARGFAAGPGGHSDYFRPGGVALHNLALIGLGRGGQVSHG
ncbi:alpha/beta hydrolase [Streptomyces sp. NPDC001851]|uniref:alpha/beta hydrolase n=1 Tax=Streptomyces sp. NPDC001851 TaxID=3154529 RepID=UPI00332108C4